MAPRNKFIGLIPAVAYYRMSSDKQEASIPEQREAVQRYAADHSYRIVREYLDEGISGDATSKREAFLRMHHDACNGRDFDAILCWDQDRFGRFDSMEAGFYIHPLREAGVTLATVNDGPVDWHDFTGRVMYQLKQEGKHQFLRDLSANVTRGLLAKAKRGEWGSGDPPYGYRIGAGDRLALGRTDELKVVRHIFREYLAGGSLRGVAFRLNAEGIPSPADKAWCAPTVRQILTRRVYTGTFVWNTQPGGKYSQVRGGQVQRVNGDIGIPDQPDDKIIIPNNHPAIISQEKFDAAQRRLAAEKPRRGGRSRTTRAADRYAFTGLLWCECGRPMHGRMDGGAPRYVCASSVNGGHRNPVRQDRLMGELFGAIHKHLADSERLERFKQAVRRRENQVDNVILKTTISRMENRIAALDQKLEKATRRMLLVDDDQLSTAQEIIEKLRDERSRLNDELQAARTPVCGTISDLDSHVAKLLKRLQALKQGPTRADIGLTRKFVQSAIRRVDLEFESSMLTHRRRYRLTGGTIELSQLCTQRQNVVNASALFPEMSDLLIVKFRAAA